MTGPEPPERLRHALAAWTEGRSRRLEALARRGQAPEPGDLYSLPCHAWADLTWVVIESLDDGGVRLAPGDDRPWANAGDVWVGEDQLCLRLASCVTLPGGLLPADQRIGVLPAAADEALEHERSMRFVKPPSRAEDDDQRCWRALVARSARILPSWLREGVVELRLSDFKKPGALDGVGEPSAHGEEVDASASIPLMAAESAGLSAAFLATMEQLDGAMLVDELDCDCGGTLQLVATQAGLSLLFTSVSRDAVPPPVMFMDGSEASSPWQAGGAIHPHANRIRFVHDWRTGPVSLRVALRKDLVLRVVDDVWFS